MIIAQPDTETLLAVILGAALATAGGFTERQVERNLQRREKERSAA
jgi:protein involved in polysaccharide export with SLBB domain